MQLEQFPFAPLRVGDIFQRFSGPEEGRVENIIKFSIPFLLEQGESAGIRLLKCLCLAPALHIETAQVVCCFMFHFHSNNEIHSKALPTIPTHVKRSSHNAAKLGGPQCTSLSEEYRVREAQSIQESCPLLPFGAPQRLVIFNI